MTKKMLLTGLSISLAIYSISSIAEVKDEYPKIELSNGIIKLGIYLPDSEKGYYRGTRFDWSGVIYQVEYKGHTYFGEWKNTHDPGVHDDITGPVEEFRTGTFDKPGSLGYNEAKPGEPFVKIGIGLLEKIEEDSYNFWHPYRILETGSWKVDYGKDWVEFCQDFDSKNGWSYQYIKRIILDKGNPEFKIEHSFKNTGSKPIETSQYNHNFFIIDNTPIGKNYTLKFPFNVMVNRDLKGAIEFREKEILFNKDLEDEALFTELEGFSEDSKDYEIIVKNNKTGAGVRINGDKPMVHLNFWTIKTTICPEPFVDASVNIGEEKTWNIIYSFFAND